MEDIVIVAATRTAVGKFGGAFNTTPAPELGAAVVKSLLEQTKVDGSHISEVIMGQVLTAGSGQNPARQTVIKAGLPEAVPGLTINKVCGSGLKAVMLGAQSIQCGDAEIVIAGGQENMSMSPHVLSGSRDGFRMGDAKLKDTMITDGLWDAYNNFHMVPQLKTLRRNTISVVRSKMSLRVQAKTRLKRLKKMVSLKMKLCLSPSKHEKVILRSIPMNIQGMVRPLNHSQV